DAVSAGPLRPSEDRDVEASVVRRGQAAEAQARRIARDRDPRRAVVAGLLGGAVIPEWNALRLRHAAVAPHRERERDDDDDLKDRSQDGPRRSPEARAREFDVA